MSGDPAEFGLAMPFVVCESKGGPYEDQAYVAGFEAGMIDFALASFSNGITRTDRTVRTDNVPQLDLIAMQHGWTMTSEPWDEDPSWSFVHFQRAST